MNINLNEIIPEKMEVFASQGVDPASKTVHKLQGILGESFDLFTSLAEPVSITSAIGIKDFEALYHGQGKNAGDNVLMHIYPRAENLAMFAITLGEKVSTKIEDLFAQNDYPMGYMLDSIASLAADKGSEILEEQFLAKLKAENLATDDTRVLGYSPGYCGWDISGQKKLFDYLEPGKIGITLNNSYLMTPLKSVSGVLVAGDKAIHRFKPNYPFCKTCKTHSCLQRMKMLG